jgi:hypothetical protein
LTTAERDRIFHTYAYGLGRRRDWSFLMKNVHTRVLAYPIEAIRPWIERAWSGTDDDVFPRDRIRTWRKNPEGVARSALVPGVTRVGHGPFSFVLAEWDGLRWRVELTRRKGWHGFDLDPMGDRTRITPRKSSLR